MPALPTLLGAFNLVQKWLGDAPFTAKAIYADAVGP